MATIAELNVAITAETAGLQHGLSDASNRFKTFGQDLSRIGLTMSAAITAPLVLLAKQIVTIGVDYERSMNVFQAVTRATGEEMGRAAQLAQQLGADMTLPATSAGDAAKAMTELAKGGLSASQAMDAAKGTLQLAAAATIDEARAAEITANALNAFGLAAADAGKISDLLAAAANASSAEIDDIALSLQQASAVFASAHVPIADLVTAIGEMANAGIKGSDAGTSLKTMMLALEAPTKKAASEMQKLGINIFDAHGSFIPFRDMIGQVANALGGMTDKQQAASLKTIFGTDAIRAANIVMAKGVEAFDEMSAAVNRSGAAQELAGAKAKGLSGGLDGLRSQLETVGLAIFNTLSPALEKVVRSVAEAVGGFANLSERTIIMGAAFLGVAGAAGPIALLIGKLLSLSPQGAIIAGVVAGSAAIAAAYAADYAKVNQTINSHVALFQKSTNEIASAGLSLTDKLEIASLAIVNLFDRIAVALERISVNVVTAGKVMAASLTGNMSGMIAVWNEGRAKLEAIDATYESNVAARIGRIHQIQGEAAFREMWARNAAASRAGAEATVKAWDDVFSQHSPALSLKEALEKYKGPTIEAARAMGSQAGSGFLSAWRQGIEQHSPSGFEKDLDRIYQAFAQFPNKIKGLASSLGAAGKEMLSEFRRAMDDIVKAIETPFRDQKIGQLIHEMIAPIVAEFQAKAKELANVLDTSLNPALRNTKIAMTDLTGPTRLGAFFQEWSDGAKRMRDATEAIQRDWESLSGTFKDLSSQLPTAWNTIIDGVLSGSGRLGQDLLKLGVKIKGFAVDAMNVLADLPGKWGKAFQQTVGEVQKWINFLDSSIKLIQRIFGETQTGLGGILQSVIGLFSKTSSSIKTSMGGIANSAGSAGTKVADMLGGTSKQATSTAKTFNTALATMEGALATFALSTAVTIGTGSKTMGFLASLGSATAAGIQAGLMGGPIAGAVVGGISLIGGLIGMFMGKSPLQKAQEAAALQKAKDDIKLSQQAVLQAFESTKQSIIETASKARELLESITFYTQVPKAAFNAFFRDLDKLMQYFAERAKAWAASASPNIKAFADDMKAVMEGIAQAPTALINIGKYLGIPEASMVRFFADLRKVLETFGTLGEDFTRKFLRHTRQFAERIGDAVALIPDITAGITGLVDIKPIPIGNLDIWEAALKEVTNRIGVIAENFDKNTAKVIGFFAEKVGPAIDLWKNSIEALKSMVDLPTPTGQDFDNLFESIRTALEGMSDLASTMSTEALVKAQSIAETSLSIFAAIKAAVEALGGLRDYKSVAQEAIDAIIADFKRGVVLLNLLILDATDFEDKAKKFRDIVLSGAAALNEGITAYVGSLTGMAKSLLDLPQGGVPLGPASQFTSLSKGQQGMTVQMQIDVHGSILSENELDDRIWEGFTTNLRRSGLTLATA